jgi:hypothetical protein
MPISANLAPYSLMPHIVTISPHSMRHDKPASQPANHATARTLSAKIIPRQDQAGHNQTKQAGQREGADQTRCSVA